MSLVIFDLDNTLIGGDSDYLWSQFLTEEGIVGPEHQRENQRFYDEYVAGTLNIGEFLAFQLAPLAQHEMQALLSWRERFLDEKIAPIMLPSAEKLIEKHRHNGETLLIITATNSFVTAPIAERLGIPHLIATEPEINNGQYTGKVAGTPSFREGKVERLNHWLKETGNNLNDSWFYSDSHNDLPLLELVTHPAAVDPDEVLKKHAEDHHWPVISLR
ncbi:MAG: HAD family hydrolase [Thiotrichaceae bacterium]|nr:HAD family hydrolase [Thiotrichaceae bacterium]PCI13727.1 MAG: HAD-IB family hydrolase [Thiotrichales bacterium]